MGDDTKKTDSCIEPVSQQIDDNDIDPVLAQKVPLAGGKEIGGRDGPDPTRFGDWEKNGRCIDF